MKKLLSLLCMILVMCAVSTTVVFAESVPAAAEETVTRIEVDETAAAAVGDSYTLTDGGEPVLEVIHVKESGMTTALNGTTTNGYYTAEFMLPETNYQVFLTGLTQDNADEIRQAIIEAYTEGEDFDLTNLGFIDAEKTWPDDGDENLCWAASASNILTYTGWAAQAGFDSEDDVFEAFIEAFNDDGGNVEYATGWFLDGAAAPGGAQPEAGTGRYLPQYNYSDVVQTFDVYNGIAEHLKTVYDRIKNGYGVSLSLDIYGSQGYEGGHAVTCWGFVTDIRYPKTSKQFCKNVFITDSDSDKYWVQEDDDRRDADDVMSLYALEPAEQEGIDTYMFNITEQQIALISEAVTVAPYSADIPYETSADATMNLLTSPDIVLDPFILTDDPDDDENTVTMFSPDATIYYHPYMMNVSNADYSGSLSLKITVTDAQGNEVYSRSFNYGNASIAPSSGLAFTKTSITQKLPVGDYTITAVFNPNHNVPEAYFFNNTRSIDFKIRNSYRLGDVDNDGVVTIIDATIIQRVLARIGSRYNTPEAIQRGDISESGGLDMMDVTGIQRYLSGIAINYPVDVTRFYD